MSEGGAGRAPKPRVMTVTPNWRRAESKRPRLIRVPKGEGSAHGRGGVASRPLLLELHELNFRNPMHPGAPYDECCAIPVQFFKSCNSNRSGLNASQVGRLHGCFVIRLAAH